MTLQVVSRAVLLAQYFFVVLANISTVFFST